MAKSDPDSIIKPVLADAFQKHQLAFMTLKQFLGYASVSRRQDLGLSKRGAAQAEIQAALDPLPETYRYRKYKNSIYLVQGHSDAQLLVDYLRVKRSKTLGQLSHLLPLKKSKLIHTVNSLLDQGRLKVRLSSSAKPVFSLAAQPAKPDAAPKPAQSETPKADNAPKTADDPNADIAAFKQAYDDVSQGSDYVFIHQIRRRLAWPRARFDHIMDALMVAGHVAAHPGNPGDLAADEVNDAYQDEFGDLYITVSWRKAV